MTETAAVGSPRAAIVRASGWAFIVLVGAVGLAAIVTAAVYPDWLGGATRELPNSPSLIAGIFVHNLLIAVTPLLGGALAAGKRLQNASRMAALYVLVPVVAVGRSVLTIGAVGGADPGWLADASRWWLLELLAMAIAMGSGWWLLTHPERRATVGVGVAVRALAAICAILATGALVEVLTA